jgi:hypothetical protein
MVQSAFVREDKKAEVRLAYLEKTKDFQPISLDDYIDVLKKCNKIFLDTIKEICGEIQILGKKLHVISEDDLDWTERNILAEKMIERLKLVV